LGTLLKGWFRPPRLVLTLFFCVMCACALALAWLGWKVIQQDRLVEAQRLQERLESAADRVVAALDRSVRRISDFADPRQPASGEVFVAAFEGSVEVHPQGSLAYSPWQLDESGTAPAVFREAEDFEFSRNSPDKAAGMYRGLAESKQAPVRAGALVRLARVLRRQRQWAPALRVYDELEKLGTLPVAGMPANLIAQAARCSVLEESGQPQALRTRAQALWADLSGGRWAISRATLDTYTDEVRHWMGAMPVPPDWNERLTLAHAAALVWESRQSAASGRWFRLLDGSPVSACWSSRDRAWHARLAGPSFWQRLCADLGRDIGARLHLAGERGEIFFGTSPVRGPAVFRAAAATGLPWNLTVAPQGDWTGPVVSQTRRALIAAGLGVFALLLALGSYAIARARMREMAVARLQADFVAAVSHEFRTPLTSIRQLTEMLARGRLDTAEQIQKAYELMLAESGRLHRLVESLLDFGRMQSGSYRFQFASLDAGEWARQVVEQFEATVRGKGYAVEFAGGAHSARIHADAEALGGALWNLLDNAVKYSPDSKRVQVDVAPVAGAVELTVRDRGIGIPREDLKHIFDRFYRGGNAGRTGAKGVGIGLATAREIVRAHGGKIRAESTPESGTVFTMVLPLEEKP
jgi:signal transduction histidine kinase